MQRHVRLFMIAVGTELVAVSAIATAGDLHAHLVLFFVLYTVAAGALVWTWYLTRYVPVRLGAVLGVALALRLPFLAGPPTLSDDVWRYLHDGRAQLAGVNPYELPPADPRTGPYRGQEYSRINHPELRTVYPPAAQLAFFLNARLGSSLLVWRLLLIAAELIAVCAIAALLRRNRRSTRNLLLYAWHPLAVVEGAGSGHLEPIGILLLFGAILASDTGRQTAAGVLFGLAAAFKFVAAPILAVTPELQRSRLVGAALATVTGCYAIYWTGGPFGSLPTFAASWEANTSAYALLHQLVDGHRARILAATLLVMAMVLIHRSRLAQAERGACFLLALLLLSPVAHPWYLLWLIAFLPLITADWLRKTILAWSTTVVLAYADLRLLTVLEFAPVYALLAAAAFTAVRRGSRPRALHPSAEKTPQISG